MLLKVFRNLSKERSVTSVCKSVIMSMLNHISVHFPLSLSLLLPLLTPLPPLLPSPSPLPPSSFLLSLSPPSLLTLFSLSFLRISPSLQEFVSVQDPSDNSDIAGKMFAEGLIRVERRKERKLAKLVSILRVN